MSLYITKPMLEGASGARGNQLIMTQSLVKRLARSRFSVIESCECYTSYLEKLNKLKLSGRHLNVRQPC